MAEFIECIRDDDRLNFVDSWYKLPANKLNIMVSFSNRDKQVYMRLMRLNYNGISLTKEEFLELIKNKDIILELYDGCNKVL